MYAFRRTSKVLAIFLVAFVCLNAGGAMCLAYCETFEVAEADHCPLSKPKIHCDSSIEPPADTDQIGGNAMDCCQLPIAFFAAPAEKSELKQQRAELAKTTEQRQEGSSFRHVFRNASDNHYRPPPNDGSRLRIHHCVLLI